jgi:hypothetical protein
VNQPISRATTSASQLRGAQTRVNAIFLTYPDLRFLQLFFAYILSSLVEIHTPAQIGGGALMPLLVLPREIRVQTAPSLLPHFSNVWRLARRIAYVVFLAHR